jgi:L-alanine-DL-glutamate epimerase-like enolase superfamily enzyme
MGCPACFELDHGLHQSIRIKTIDLFGIDDQRLEQIIEVGARRFVDVFVGVEDDDEIAGAGEALEGPLGAVEGGA